MPFGPQDKQLCIDKGPGAVRFGRSYYKSMKQMYASEENTDSKLKACISDQGEVVSPKIFKAVMKAQGAKPDLTFLMQALRTMEEAELNMKSLVGLLRCVVEMHPATGSQRLSLGKEALKFCSRLDLNIKYEAPIAAISEYMNEVCIVVPFGNKGQSTPHLNFELHLGLWSPSPPSPP